MLKLLGKILVIVVVTALFTAGIYYLVQNTTSVVTGGFGDREFESENGSRPSNPNLIPASGSQQPQGRPQRDGFREGREGGFSFLRGLAGLIGHGLQIAVVTLLVLFIRRLLRNRNLTDNAAPGQVG
jgi:hypothetical protein